MDRDIVDPESFLRYLGKGINVNISYSDCVLLLYDNSLVRFVKKNFRYSKIGGFLLTAF